MARSIEERNWEICGHAVTSASALDQVPTLQPDVVIADISLPDKNGIELIKDLRALMPDLRIVVFSMHDEMLYAEHAMRAGARGYVMKGESPSVLIHAIEEVLQGRNYLSAAASSHLLRNMASGKGRRVYGMDRLTDRELEIFELVGRGKSSAQISSLLHISPKTVDAHRMNIKTKLGLPDAPSLVRAAVIWIERGKPVERL